MFFVFVCDLGTESKESMFGPCAAHIHTAYAPVASLLFLFSLYEKKKKKKTIDSIDSRPGPVQLVTLHDSRNLSKYKSDSGKVVCRVNA
jgi:hypothetical protein